MRLFEFLKFYPLYSFGQYPRPRMENGGIGSASERRSIVHSDAVSRGTKHS